MKPRRVIITIEVETNLPIADLRRLEMVQFLPRDGWSYDIHNLEGTDQGERIVQVQVNAIRPKRDAHGLRNARYWRSIAKAVARKAKRAKGAK